MANRPTQRQMEALVEFLERNPGIAKGLLRTQQAKVEARRRWQEFATAANALGGVIKDGPAWSKYWSEKKCGLKRLCQQRAQSMRRTGGGVDTLPELSLLEQRLVAVMGGHSFATGDRGIAVDPFPHSSPSASILSPPSTSRATAAEAEVLNFVIVPETEERVQNSRQAAVDVSQQMEPSQQVEASQRAEASQQAEASHVQSAIRRSPRSPRRRLRVQSRPSSRVSFLDTQVRRFEEIEARRVEAEMLTAQGINRIADAMMEMTRLLALHLERDRRDHPPYN